MRYTLVLVAAIVFIATLMAVVFFEPSLKVLVYILTAAIVSIVVTSIYAIKKKIIP